METNFECGECGSKSIQVICQSLNGWMVKCWNGHEIIPIPSTVIYVKETSED